MARRDVDNLEVTSEDGDGGGPIVGRQRWERSLCRGRRRLAKCTSGLGRGCRRSNLVLGGIGAVGGTPKGDAEACHEERWWPLDLAGCNDAARKLGPPGGRGDWRV